MSGDYSNYYKQQLEDAQLYQDWLMKVLIKHGVILQVYGSKEYQYKKGESVSGDEIKLDKKMKDTGNLYIELAEKSHPNNSAYVKSGIQRDEIRRWIHGDYDTVYVFDVVALKRAINAGNFREVQTPTSIGKLIPRIEADKICSHRFRINDGDLVPDNPVVIIRPDVMSYKKALDTRGVGSKTLDTFGGEV